MVLVKIPPLDFEDEKSSSFLTPFVSHFWGHVLKQVVNYALPSPLAMSYAFHATQRGVTP
jgi:hypothetical protein